MAAAPPAFLPAGRAEGTRPCRRGVAGDPRQPSLDRLRLVVGERRGLARLGGRGGGGGRAALEPRRLAALRRASYTGGVAPHRGAAIMSDTPVESHGRPIRRALISV